MPTDRAALAGYAIASAALLAPVLVWPAIWRPSAFPVAAAQFDQMWLGAGISLLVAAATADSMLARPRGVIGLIRAIGWLLGAMAVGATALRLPHGGAWLLGCGFSLHALRPLPALWRSGGDARAWIAWLRDTTAALALFAWGTVGG